MRFVTVLIALVFALSASAALYAQGRGNAQAKKTTVSAPKAKATQTPKQTKQTTKTAKAETRVAKADTRAAKATTKAETRAAKAATKTEARAAKAETKAARKGETVTTASTTTTEVTPTTPTTTTVKNPKLEAKLLAMLPAGTTIQDASSGFKNWGQFVAATHVSTNLGIPFADLKAAMTGIPVGATTTIPTATPMSLGQAIQTVQGTIPVTATPLTPTTIQTEVKKAEDAATADLRRTRASS